MAMFDELDNEIFAFLFWVTLTIGLIGAALQFYFFSLINRIFPFTKISCFLLIFLIELGFMNIVYHQAEGRSLTWNVIFNILGNLEGYNLKRDISMHVAILVSCLIGTFLLEQKNLEEENKEGNL
jgi:hypothetical protein